MPSRDGGPRYGTRHVDHTSAPQLPQASMMTDPFRVILEIGKKRRVVAGAMDWPGLDRWGTSDDDAIAKLASYRPRYATVAQAAGLTNAFAAERDIEVVERVPGSSSTDFWGVA